MKIEYRNGVLATTLLKPQKILLHTALQKPEFAGVKKKLLDHEVNHDPKPFHMRDLIADLNFQSMDPDLIYFITSHPDSMLQSLGAPLLHEGKLYWDKGVLFQWGLVITVGVLAWILI